ncbi:MAG: hypothetical protein Q8M86_05810 [Syntrophales bacterium]|nr:hypothetical protein [Syntrophales bacterium]
MRKKVPTPKIGTQAAKEFFSSWRDINRLFDFVLLLAGSAEQVAKTAHETLIKTEHDEGKRAEMEAKWKSRRSAIDELKANRQLLLETILVRHVENFINYLSAVLFEIFTTRPETLKSSDKVEVSKVLEHDSIESLVREIAETKVDSLSYSSFSKLSEFFEERFRIPIASESDAKLIHEYIEIRNISVHNRCHVNKRFVARMNLAATEIGKKKAIYGEALDMLTTKLAEVVKAMDIVVRRKMKVKGVRFGVG